MAFRLENTYTKDKILELYVNSIYFGDGYYCVRDASRGYFGKEPIDMTGYESTLLAGMIHTSKQLKDKVRNLSNLERLYKIYTSS